MKALDSLRLAFALLSAEGPASVVRRTLDRLAERKERRSFAPGNDAPEGVSAPVLHVLSTPPAPRRGGVQTQLVARRLRERAAGRPFALFFPWAGRYRLEIEQGSRRTAIDLAPATPGPPLGPPEPEAGTWVRAVRDAFARTHARILRIEGTAGLPLDGLVELSTTLPLTLAIHDFALFCPRPHLAEEPTEAFCHASRDLARCLACLRRSWTVKEDFQARRRELAARLVSGVDRIVFPSEFLRRAHLELFPNFETARARVEAPSHLPAENSPSRRLSRLERPRAPRRIAFVGAARRFKGAEVFSRVVAQLSADHPEIEWHAFGGGDLELLHRLRAQGVVVHGYYRAGSLPEQLARHRIDLALLLSIVPESYGLTLDECSLASVPFLTFDLGAQGERAAALGGTAVPLESDAAGIAERIAALVSR